MNKYFLEMNGRNFLINFDDSISKHGFLQQFYIEAGTPEEAENLAVEKIKNDVDLNELTLNPQDDSPSIFLERIQQLENFDGIENPISGKIWYREKRWWQFWK